MGFEVITMIKGPKKIVSVTLPLELYEWIALLAEDTCRSVPGYIRQVLKGYRWHLEHCPEALKDWPTARAFAGERAGRVDLTD